MNTLKRGFILLVAVLFLVVSIGGAQAGTTVKGSKSNADNIVSSPSAGDTGDSSPSQPTTVKSSKSNASYRGKGEDPKTKSINLNSSRTN